MKKGADEGILKMVAQEDQRSQIRQLIRLISELRAQDAERYKNHVAFMQEVVAMIKSISESMNKSWSRISESLEALNQTIKISLDTLLTGVSPEGIRETSFSLKEIMETMNRSIQSMNLENVVRELRALMGGGAIPRVAVAAGGAEEELVEGGAAAEEPEVYGYVPNRRKKEKKEEEAHLLKPSDLFGSGLQADFDDPDQQ
ncbi:MAG: hypothetical protein Kow0069_37610 [Promethearchaeota archaeon]